ncbi:MAG: hypothetical protein RRB13_11910 [bacterium]|nr:hypothetical protein [bacterium]
MFEQRKTPIGVLVPEAGDTAWQNHFYRSAHLIGAILKSQSERSRLLAGSWDGTDLSGVVAEFFDPLSGGLVVEAKTDLPGLVIPTVPTLYYAKQGLSAIQSVPLEVFTNTSWTLDQIPVLVAGYYQNTTTTTAPFAEFVGPMSDPRISRGEPDLIINGGCRTAQYDSYALGAGCVGRGNRQFGAVDRMGFFTTEQGTGTADQYAQSNLSGGYSARLNGVTLPVNGKLHRVYRMEAKDAARLKGGQISLAFESLHNASSDKTVTVYLRYANSADDFSAVTDIGNDGGKPHPGGVIKLHGLDAFDLTGVPVQNGLEIEIELDCGAVSGLTWEIGALRAHRRRTAMPELMLPGIGDELFACMRYYQVHGHRLFYAHPRADGQNYYAGATLSVPLRDYTSAAFTLSSANFNAFWEGQGSAQSGNSPVIVAESSIEIKLFAVNSTPVPIGKLYYSLGTTYTINNEL